MRRVLAVDTSFLISYTGNRNFTHKKLSGSDHRLYVSSSTVVTRSPTCRVNGKRGNLTPCRSEPSKILKPKLDSSTQLDQILWKSAQRSLLPTMRKHSPLVTLCTFPLLFLSSPTVTKSHAIARMTARCVQYMSALKIVCKRKISRRLRKNLHITILSLIHYSAVKLFSKYSNLCDHGT